MNDALKKLEEIGVAYNGWSIKVLPNYIQIDSQVCRLRIPMTVFKRFAVWYLEDQQKAPPA